jgi:hypothetical protein
VETGDKVEKQSKLDIESYVNELARADAIPVQPTPDQKPVSLEEALKGRTVELWSNAAGRFSSWPMTRMPFSWENGEALFIPRPNWAG